MAVATTECAHPGAGARRHRHAAAHHHAQGGLVQAQQEGQDQTRGAPSHTSTSRHKPHTSVSQIETYDNAAARAQVQELLEQAGFSRHNPYNIVQQGKIARMSQLSDVERLGMLKEIGGASVYENKRKESDRLLDANQQRIRDIDATVRAPSPSSFAHPLVVVVTRRLNHGTRRREHTLVPKKKEFFAAGEHEGAAGQAARGEQGAGAVPQARQRAPRGGLSPPRPGAHLHCRAHRAGAGRAHLCRNFRPHLDHHCSTSPRRACVNLRRVGLWRW